MPTPETTLGNPVTRLRIMETQKNETGTIWGNGMNKPLKILSLGWGVQSWTLAAMAALNYIPKPDYAVHADTQHEMSGTYAHAKKWTPWLISHGIKVMTVSADNTRVFKTKKTTSSIEIPAFGENGGQIRRQCTQDWKIRPIRKFIRKIVNPRESGVEMWQGISLDEWSRMRTSDVRYIENIYPLVDKRMTRKDCITWLASKKLDIPPKSSCTFCPYHNVETWKSMKRSNNSDWWEAVNTDTAIRNALLPGQLFLSSKKVPLPKAINIPEDHGASQLELPCDSGYCFN